LLLDKIYKKCLYLGHIAEFERKKIKCQVKTEEHAGGVPRHARNERSAGLKETLKFRGCPGKIFPFETPYGVVFLLSPQKPIFPMALPSPPCALLLTAARIDVHEEGKAPQILGEAIRA
jgi:hypothetical protein